MTQTLAIFYEAYRNLNSKKLFWITLFLSGLVVAVFALLGVNEQGLTFAAWQLDLGMFSALFSTRNISSAVFYKMLFESLGVSIWLSWIAAILALVSTAGIFPDLMTSGGIDLYLSKPISRLRLFLTEYVAGLLFVALQVTVFSLASFLVIGLRGGTWEPGLFIAVPIVVCLFSYVFAVCVLFGVVTRSTVASLLLTLVFWFFLGLLGFSELQMLQELKRQKHEGNLSGVVVTSSENGKLTTQLDAGPGPGHSTAAESAPPEGEVSPAALNVHRTLYAARTVFPKTYETIEILRRTLYQVADISDELYGPDKRTRAAEREFAEEIENRSVAWILGTSLGFEAAVLAVAAFLFCRRDF